MSRKGTPTTTAPPTDGDKLADYRVADNTQLNVAGELHPGGGVVELPESVARGWVLRGVLQPEPNHSISRRDKTRN